MGSLVANFTSRRAYRAARRAYVLARLESLLAENERRRAELDAITQCPWCMEMGDPCNAEATQ